VDLNNLNIEKAKAILQQELAKALIEQRIRNQALRELGTIDRLATVKEAYEILRFHRKAVNCSLRYFTKMVADRKLNLKIHEAFHPKNPKQPLYLIEFTEPADLELLIRIRNKNAKNKAKNDDNVINNTRPKMMTMSSELVNGTKSNSI